LLGVVSLIGGVLRTRFNWRPDVPAFSRRTNSLDVTLHPERYARPESLQGIRRLNLAGVLLIASAVGVLAYEAFRDLSSR
jgi:hypothetical protein